MDILTAVYAVVLLTYLHNTSHIQVPGVYLALLAHRVYRVLYGLFNSLGNT